MMSLADSGESHAGNPGPSLEGVRAAMARGEYLMAYDEVMAALELRPDDLALQYQAVLALARAGAIDRAGELVRTFGFDRPHATALAPDLAEDLAALAARLAKDRALASVGAERTARARQAAESYEAIYRRMGRPYTCINAATMWLVAREGDRAKELAFVASDLCARATPSSREDEYWLAATQAEASLIVGDFDAVAEALERAAARSIDELAVRATTRKQLLLVCAAIGVEPSVLDPLSIPTVIQYCGHMIARSGERGRFPAEEEKRVAAEVDAFLDSKRVGFGFGSLGCGADILVAEALVERGAELHVALPFASEEFKAVSVATGGDGWVERFERCLAAATSVTYATEGAYLGDDSLFDYAARLAMGHALIRARFLSTDVEQLAIWDGVVTRNSAGTASDIRTWQARGRTTHVIATAATGPPGEPELAAVREERVLRAILFADIRGFSRLPDSKMSAFLDSVMTPLAATLDRFACDIEFRNTWGDGLYVVMRSATRAAECALALQDTMSDLDLSSAGLPLDLALRIGAHAGPVVPAQDPVRRERNFYGVHVTWTARIEPRTPEGDVYVTDPFAALVALEDEETLSCEYVGHIPTAKGYGTFPMYVLKRRT